ncbi:hypothetical protein [Bacillus sp. JJ1562]|uniref:hypothetical protein n=1 Tax=Bacillus sp. JJ1562 TaxID=3122960 RepID=UPI00300162C8
MSIRLPSENDVGARYIIATVHHRDGVKEFKFGRHQPLKTVERTLDIVIGKEKLKPLNQTKVRNEDWAGLSKWI